MRKEVRKERRSTKTKERENGQRRVSKNCINAEGGREPRRREKAEEGGRSRGNVTGKVKPFVKWKREESNDKNLTVGTRVKITRRKRSRRRE